MLLQKRVLGSICCMGRAHLQREAFGAGTHPPACQHSLLAAWALPVPCSAPVLSMHPRIFGLPACPPACLPTCLPARCLQSALTVLEALLDNDFDDFNGIRTDPDLASLRGPELDSLLAK